mmetsp:Transcript_21708/g.61549  ORF Transcript_21708/g.61549 Transcript_21708/m.61549 type:complete len:566 (-) Transcript_21708:202-1899(-)
MHALTHLCCGSACLAATTNWCGKRERDRERRRRETSHSTHGEVLDAMAVALERSLRQPAAAAVPDCKHAHLLQVPVAHIEVLARGDQLRQRLCRVARLHVEGREQVLRLRGELVHDWAPAARQEKLSGRRHRPQGVRLPLERHWWANEVTSALLHPCAPVHLSHEPQGGANDKERGAAQSKAVPCLIAPPAAIAHDGFQNLRDRAVTAAEPHHSGSGGHRKDVRGRGHDAHHGRAQSLAGEDALTSLKMPLLDRLVRAPGDGRAIGHDGTQHLVPVPGEGAHERTCLPRPPLDGLVPAACEDPVRRSVNAPDGLRVAAERPEQVALKAPLHDGLVPGHGEEVRPANEKPRVCQKTQEATHGHHPRCDALVLQVRQLVLPHEIAGFAAFIRDGDALLVAALLAHSRVRGNIGLPHCLPFCVVGTPVAAERQTRAATKACHHVPGVWLPDARNDGDVQGPAETVHEGRRDRAREHRDVAVARRALPSVMPACAALAQPLLKSGLGHVLHVGCTSRGRHWVVGCGPRGAELRQQLESALGGEEVCKHHGWRAHACRIAAGIRPGVEIA